MRHSRTFSSDYATARDRLIHAGTAAGWTHHALPLGDDVGPDLSIDVLHRGREDARRIVVVSSGLHGVEGHLGSAIQLAMLEGPLQSLPLPDDGAILLLHALNPYGFAHTRRVDQDNIDLNRNFLLDGQAHAGAPDGYAAIDPIVNPRRPPRLRAGFYARALALLAREGMAALKDVLPVGQYAFDKGLFYGGSGPSRTQEILRDALPRWLHTADRVLHLDIHTGIGRWATYKLFPSTTDPERVEHLEATFGADVVEGWDPARTSYTIRGGLGPWLEARFPGARYDLVTAEFGTYHVLRVVEALATENAHHHWGDPRSRAARAAKRRLQEAFAPADATWRHHCVEQGLGIVRQALRDTLEVG